jgi:hypothetical protein
VVNACVAATILTDLWLSIFVEDGGSDHALQKKNHRLGLGIKNGSIDLLILIFIGGRLSPPSLPTSIRPYQPSNQFGNGSI